MSNVQAAIKRNGIVMLLILLAALAVLLAGVRSGGPSAASADTSVLPYQDPSLPVAQRVAEFLLLDRLFPRSALHALTEAEECLEALAPSTERAGTLGCTSRT